jgi:uncharacterized protein (DUF2132 family)
MSFWADQFVEVCYWARQFKLAWDQAHNHSIHPQLRVIHQTHLSYVRMNLLCAMATYQLCIKKQQKELCDE